VERVKERLAIARKALRTLLEILQESKTAVVRDAAIQRFEYTFEAVWKSVQIYLRTMESLEAGSPRGAIRFSHQVGLLTEEQTRCALAMADDRNLTVHTYNEALAEKIYSHLFQYAPLMRDWLAAMEQQLQTK
jgi:nucleotidyltransferase substrate binding protein (TIGR01987 family)